MTRQLIFALGLAFALAPLASAETRYVVDLSDGATGRLNVRAETVCRAEPCDFILPVWSATYQVRDFAQYVGRVEATDGAGAPRRVSKVAPHLWRVEAGVGERIQLAYRTLADRPGPFGAYVDSEYAALNLAQVLAFPAAGRGRRCTLRFSGLPVAFNVAVALPEADGVFEAPSYDRLVDTPVYLGNFLEQQFEVDRKRIRVVAGGAISRTQLDGLAATAKKLVSAGFRLMGELPFDSYTFAYFFSEEDGGGMEYRDGTMIFAAADCRNCGLPGLTAHEFFHLWNVKRIRPASMEPIDYVRANPSPSLWFSEGVTSTYADYLQIMAGLLSGPELSGRLERLISDYEARPAARTQSAEESSIEAWLERHPAYGRRDRSVSYYLKGELIGHVLDLTIRHHTGNRRSLDDLMRRLNEDYARQGRFFADTDALERIAGEIAGHELGPVFDRLVRRPDGIAWDKYLGYAGLRLESTESKRAGVGMTLSNPAGQGVLVNDIAAGGPAERAGLRRGDRLLRVDGRRITAGANEVVQRLERMSGRSVRFTIERRGAVQVLDVEPVEETVWIRRIVEIPDASAAQKAVRRGWMTRTVRADSVDSSGS